MANLLVGARNFSAQSLARLRSSEQTGPEIHVEPFDHVDASTGAGLIKLATSISSARRHAANVTAANATAAQDRALTLEKTRAEIAKLRAEAQPKAVEPKYGNVSDRDMTLPDGTVVKAGTPIAVIGQMRGVIKDKRAHDSEGRRTSLSQQITAERAALGQIDANVKRESDLRAATAMAKLEPYISAVTGPDTPIPGRKFGLRQHALGVLRDVAGVDLSPYAENDKGVDVNGKPLPLSPEEILARQKQARSEIQAALAAKARREVGAPYDSQRNRHQVNIDSLTRNYNAEASNSIAPSDAGGMEGDEGEVEYVRDPSTGQLVPKQ